MVQGSGSRVNSLSRVSVSGLGFKVEAFRVLFRVLFRV